MRLLTVLIFCTFYFSALTKAQVVDFRDYLKEKTKNKENPIEILKSEFCENDLKKAIQYDRIGLELQKLGLLDSARVYHLKGLEFAKSYSDSNEEIGLAYNKLGILAYYEGDIENSCLLLDSALIYIETPKFRANALNNLGLMNKRLNRPEVAIENFMEAQSFYKENGDSTLLVIVANNIGGMHFAMGNMDQALDYHRKGEEYALDINDRFGIAESRMGIASVYSETKQHKLAIPKLKEAISYFDSVNNPNYLIVSYNNLANCLDEIGEKEESYQIYFKTLTIMDESGIKGNKDAILLNIASYFEGEKEFRKSLGYSFKSLQEAKENSNVLYYESIYKSLANSYQQLGILDSSIIFKNLQIAIKDSLDQIEKEKKMLELESQYNNIELSTDLEDTKDELEASEIESGSFSKTITSISIVLGMLALVTLIFYFLYKNRSNKANELEQESSDKQKTIGYLSEAISEKDKEIELLSQRDENNLLLYPKELTPLTEREKEVLLGLLDALQDKEIGEKLFISVSTVKTHLRRAYVKIDVRNRLEAIKFMSTYKL